MSSEVKQGNKWPFPLNTGFLAGGCRSYFLSPPPRLLLLCVFCRSTSREIIERCLNSNCLSAWLTWSPIHRKATKWHLLTRLEKEITGGICLSSYTLFVTAVSPGSINSMSHLFWWRVLYILSVTCMEIEKCTHEAKKNQENVKCHYSWVSIYLRYRPDLHW